MVVMGWVGVVILGVVYGRDGVWAVSLLDVASFIPGFDMFFP